MVFSVSPYYYVLKSSQAATISVVPLKGDLAYLPVSPAVETAGYFHSSGWCRTSTHLRQSVQISVHQR
jgi:hypothetical protein